jgi:asparagine synthase (glutamine-hydrolysing)
MCGIAGTFDAGERAEPGEALAQVQRMAGLIVHRGPDADGFLVDDRAALASRRLAIIDLSEAGRQPVYNEDGSIGLVYNGELYNFGELRRELQERGHRFRSRSDTEVVVHAYEEFGPACVRRFNGMFAFAIWDRRRQALFLARDRFGVKPLYYTWLGGTLAVASEVKAFLALPAFRVELDHEALAEYLTFQNVFSDRTLFKGVRLLPPGTTLTVDRDGTVRTDRYWSFTFAATEDRGGRYYADGVRARFEEAVRRQLMSDVPVGSYLSGGMDSGSICAVASRQIPRLQTFTGGFSVAGAQGDEVHADERAGARSMAQAMGTIHQEVAIEPGDLERTLPDLVWHLEDLRVGSSYHNFLVARRTSQSVKVVLSGAGGDELFAGYPWRYAHAAGARSRSDFARRYGAYWSLLVPDEAKPGLFAGPLAAAARGFSAADAAGEVVRDAPADDPLNLALTFEARTYLPGLFIVEDKLSMAHSLEARVPFLDNDLVDFACAMPNHHKLDLAAGSGAGSTSGTTGGTGSQAGHVTSKLVLRRAMQGLIPDHILWARKQGFVPPEDAWYRGPILPYIRRTLLSKRSLDRGLFQPYAVARTLDEHAAGTCNHKKLLWSLLCLEWWHRLFLDGERPATAAATTGHGARPTAEASRLVQVG